MKIIAHIKKYLTKNESVELMPSKGCENWYRMQFCLMSNIFEPYFVEFGNNVQVPSYSSFFFNDTGCFVLYNLYRRKSPFFYIIGKTKRLVIKSLLI